jgi:hypothetical protein
VWLETPANPSTKICQLLHIFFNFLQRSASNRHYYSMVMLTEPEGPLLHEVVFVTILRTKRLKP